tara:strand:+ start:838 stop:1146 length:309 start_codon:yes stop_codon:yes gene_type:complete
VSDLGIIEEGLMDFWNVIKDFFSGFANGHNSCEKQADINDESAVVEDKVTCATCGSGNLKKNGIETKTPNPYQRYRCMDCGSALRGRLQNKGVSENTYIREI